ncbi:MAG TPA: hypothetical protein VLJ39_02165 [Tepidisphaeraceae bacterium]|nr:hypothetical protein [Tepidisphaeraceae bacterium]
MIGKTSTLWRVGVLVAASLLLAGSVTRSHAQEMSATRPTAATTRPAAGAETVQTIIFFRHGEKPVEGFGQLTPKGLNRALALSEMLPKRFGKPDYLFAPDPKQKVNDRGGQFNYVRPLATIEPTAIRLGMPVQTPCGYKEIERLNAELCKPQYANAKIFVAWEHLYEQRAVAGLFASCGGDSTLVPAWSGTDYDSLYILTIRRSPNRLPTATFTHDQENLNGESDQMPVPAAK